MNKANRQTIEASVAHVQHGFKEMQQCAREIVASSDPLESFALAQELFSSDQHQTRMVAVFVMGYLSHHIADALSYLRRTVSLDPSWQVQEILAQAFNQYCQDTGYEQALPDIQAWLADPSPQVKRAVSEGLRIWNRRAYFQQHPEVAISLLSPWKDHESEYLRKSIGNALRDISRSEKTLVRQELASWDLSNPRVNFTYKLASKFLTKEE
jgi:3-methyladenine DNA glycosylase AlkC